MKKSILVFLAIASSFYVLTGCNLFGNVDNEEEVITTVDLTFVDSSDVSNTVKAIFKDTDGSGGNAPTQFDDIRLMPNKTYTLKVGVFDESKSGKKEDIGAEILKEADDHQFFFVKNGVNLTVSYLDKDSKNKPLGLQTKWKTGNASQGKVKITLKHQPNTKDGNIGTGSTDVELDWTTKIE